MRNNSAWILAGTHRAPRINLTAGRVRFYLLTLLTLAADVRAQCSVLNFLFDIDRNLRQYFGHKQAVVWEFSTILTSIFNGKKPQKNQRFSKPKKTLVLKPTSKLVE